MHYATSLIKTPQHTSALTGLAWVKELLAGHPTRFYNMLGMHKPVFVRLISELSEFGGLKSTRHVMKVEALAIFLRMARIGASNREMQERFQRSADTISKFVFQTFF